MSANSAQPEQLTAQVPVWWAIRDLVQALGSFWRHKGLELKGKRFMHAVAKEAVQSTPQELASQLLVFSGKCEG
jgi:hypothetical protein